MGAPFEHLHRQPRKVLPHTQEVSRIAWFSPLSDAARSTHGWSPSAYVSRVLVPEVAKRAEVVLFHDEFRIPQWCGACGRGEFDGGSHKSRGSLETLGTVPEVGCGAEPGLSVRHFLTAADCDRNRPFDVCVYHLEDHRRTGFSRIHLGLKPGLVWFHDFLLTDDGPEPILNSPWQRTVDRFFDQQAPWAKPEEEFSRPRPHAVREVSVGGVPVFTSERDLNEFRRLRVRTLAGELDADSWCDGASEGGRTSRENSFFIPYPVPAELFERRIVAPTSRGMGAVSASSFVIGWCGGPRIEQRSAMMCEALARASAAGANLSAHWMVPHLRDEALARAMLREFEISERVTLRIGESFDDWIALLPSLDCAMHLHFSAFGQPGPALALSMAAGVPVVVSDFGVSEHLSSKVVFKIQPGVSEAHELAALWQQLAGRDLSAHREKVRALAHERHHVASVAADFLRVRTHSRGVLERMRVRWNALEREAREDLLRTIGVGSQSLDAVADARRARWWFDDERGQWLARAADELHWTPRE